MFYHHHATAAGFWRELEVLLKVEGDRPGDLRAGVARPEQVLVGPAQDEPLHADHRLAVLTDSLAGCRMASPSPAGRNPLPNSSGRGHANQGPDVLTIAGRRSASKIALLDTQSTSTRAC